MDWSAQIDNVPVLVPWTTDNGSRQAVWDVLRPKLWSQATVYEGVSPEGLYNRSAALNDAAQQAGDWDFAVIADADSFVTPKQLSNALDFAERTGKVTLPYSVWVNVEPDEIDLLWETGQLENRPGRITHMDSVSSVVVVPRKIWDRVNGFDENFVGWGYEDRAFMRAAGVMGGGFNRMPGHVFHLEHERSTESVDLYKSQTVVSNRDRWGAYLRTSLKSDMANLVGHNRATLDSA